VVECGIKNRSEKVAEYQITHKISCNLNTNSKKINSLVNNDLHEPIVVIQISVSDIGSDILHIRLNHTFVRHLETEVEHKFDMLEDEFDGLIQKVESPELILQPGVDLPFSQVRS